MLQVKEAQASVLEPFAGASEYEHHGERVVVGQRRLQAAGDALLGWTRIETRTRRRANGTTTCASSGTGREAPRSRG